MEMTTRNSNKSTMAINGEGVGGPMGYMLRKHEELFDSFNLLAMLCSDKHYDSRDIEELYPIFEVMNQGLDVFAKVYLINETQNRIHFSDVRYLNMSDADRFMLSMMGYNLWDTNKFDVTLIDSIPDTIHGDSRLIAKKIVKNRLTNEESAKLNGILKMFKENSYKFSSLIQYAGYTDEELRIKTDNWSGWRYVHEARETGWFPHMGTKTYPAEDRFCEANHISNNFKKKALPKSNVINESTDSRYVDEIVASMQKMMVELVTAINGEPNDIIEIDPIDVKEIKTITMKDIYNYATSSGYAINQNGGIESLIDSIDRENTNAAFSIGTILKPIFGIGQKVVPAMIGILGPIIDVISAVAKKDIKKNPTNMSERISKYIPDNTVIAIDEGVNAIKGLGDLLRGIIAELVIIRDSDDVKTQCDAIDRIADLLKKNLNMMEDPKLRKLVDRMMGKAFDLADEAGINKNIADQVVQHDIEDAAMMNPQQGFPGSIAVQHPQDTDSSKPVWLDAISQISTAIRESKLKITPEFIAQANADAKAAQESQVPAVQYFPGSVTIDPNVTQECPWINQIADIAVKNGLSVNITPFLSRNENGYSIIAVRVETSVNGVSSPEKSFTIDLGYIFDKRIKMFFNYGVNGFAHLETCDEAYHVLDKDGKNIDKDIFELVFKYGISSIKEADRRRIRMYNSNMAKVNRTIVFATVPTNMVIGEERKALKDSIFKCEKVIKSLGVENGFSFGRFALFDFDPATLSYTLDNQDVWVKGQPQKVPHIKFKVTIQKDSKGNIVKDDDGKCVFNFILTYADNVFSDGVMKFPKGMKEIYGSPEQNEALFQAGPESLPAHNEDDEDDSTTPEFIAQSGEDAESE